MNAESVWGRNPRGYPIGIKTTLPPTFAPGAGTYTSIQTVTMSCLTPFAVIYYTTNGSTPTTGSTIYTSPITVGTTETVKAIAQAPGATASSVTSALYTINLTTTATPTFSPPAGSYSSEQTVAISCSTPSSTIYYTTNGTTPTTSSPVYTGPISVGGTSTIQAIATAAGFLQSAVGSATYTITNSTQYVGTNISVLQDAPTEQPFLNIAKLTRNFLPAAHRLVSVWRDDVPTTSSCSRFKWLPYITSKWYVSYELSKLADEQPGPSRSVWNWYR